jgi:homoserine dehydrogenase
MSVDSFVTSGTSPSHKRCRVAILGFGTVGSAIATRLAGADPVDGLELTHILDRRAFAKRDALTAGEGRSLASANIVWTTRFEDILASDAEIVVEAIGGIEPAAEWIRASLAAGKSAVTANKQVIAHHGPSLLALAERQGRQLRFEAAVGGAMPIVRAVSDGLSGDRLTRIVAILNGTSNAVLSRMEAVGCTVPQALAEARARGWAEADPSIDLDGLDARAKLGILCALGFGLRVDPARIETRSIAQLQPADFDLARRRGGTIRQVAFAQYDRGRVALTAWVAPAIVPFSSIFARTVGPENAALISGAHAGDVGVVGVGAGGAATAVAAIGDLLTIARDRAAIVPAPVLSAPALITGIGRGADMVDLVDLVDLHGLQGRHGLHGLPGGPANPEFAICIYLAGAS